MTYICSECGNEIPDDMDFCPHCGCMKSKAFQMSQSGALTHRTCPECGAQINEGDQYCGSCGAKVQYVQVPMMKMRKYGMIAVALAVIPGFFNVFGLGHLLMKEWSKGIMFLVISAVLWYIDPFGTSTNVVMMLASIFVFVYQAMDIFNVIYKPEVK